MSKIPSRRINSPFLIGLFVITGIIVIIGVVFWLGASQFLKSQVKYVTYFEGSVEGLESGSAVKYQGVPVGAVADIGVAPDGRLIEVIMLIDPKIDINDSLRVKAELAGIAGGKFLQLYYPTDQKIAAMFPEVTFNTQFRLIRSSPSGLEEIEIAMREVINNLRRLEVTAISEETIKFLSASTEFFSNPDLYETIENIKEGSDMLQGIIVRADTSKILDFIANASARLYQTTNELKTLADKLNEQVDNLRLDEHVDGAFKRYDSTMYSIDKVVNTLGYRTESSIISLNETLEEIRGVTRQLKKTLRGMEENPSQMFLSEPPPEED